MNQNHSEERTADEAMLVQRAIGRDAEDLTHQVFLKAWQAIDDIKSGKPICCLADDHQSQPGDRFLPD